MKEAQGLGRQLLSGWAAIAGHFGFVQTLVILTLVYALILGPTALAISLARKDMLSKRRLHEPTSAWAQADSAKPDLERAKLLS